MFVMLNREHFETINRHELFYKSFWGFFLKKKRQFSIDYDHRNFVFTLRLILICFKH